MKRVRTGWSDLGGLIKVCLMATFIVAFAGVSSLCRAEGPATASSAVIADCEAVDLDDRSPDDHPADNTDACLHGHCHDGPAVAMAAAAFGTPSAAAQRHFAMPDSAPNSRDPSGLERPPRA